MLKVLAKLGVDIICVSAAAGGMTGLLKIQRQLFDVIDNM